MDTVSLNGAPGSPYSRKMLAVLRYRRIPYRLFWPGREPVDYPVPKVRLLPTFYLPGADGALTAVTDSTPLIRRFEREYSDRLLRPASPALAFLDSLLEDYGDEWLTKAMFHYRWAYKADIDQASGVLPSWRGTLDDEMLAAMGKAFSERQISRLRYVGSNPTTGPVIEASYVRLLELLENHLKQHGFLLGGRPGAGDFGLYGQLTQLAAFDPTPTALAATRAPRVMAWVQLVEDLCGLEPADRDWFDPANLPDTLIAILAETGRVYAPLMAANAKAVMAGAESVETEIDGQPWSQQPFPYQAKCLMWLREEYAALGAADRELVDKALAGTGWAGMFG
ncbi:MAG: glutathione S-transferase C-terminal domain-containing protein [Caulobacter sp.]|nr:glutathione S-transferase C-terminal domain-containing protein [Caulobacter sp.]